MGEWRACLETVFDAAKVVLSEHRAKPAGDNCENARKSSFSEIVHRFEETSKKIDAFDLRFCRTCLGLDGKMRPLWF